VRDLLWERLRPHHPIAVITDEREHRVPRYATRESTSVKRERREHAIFIDLEIRDGDG
jgi:hypothetical protein